MWNPNQYLKFADERTRPCRDLADHIAIENPERIIDLGCGPGNSTAVLRERWPTADITGLDNSPEMIASARRTEPGTRWIERDVNEWASTNTEKYDLVFSNAALQWVPDHHKVFPLLFTHVRTALAIQMPATSDAPAHVLMREIRISTKWESAFEAVKQWHAHSPEDYFDLLSPFARTVDLWQTEYIHVLANAEAIVEWFKGSALRPYLDLLVHETDRQRFLEEYLEGIRQRYPLHDGKILFPFRRTFLIAYK